MEDIKTLLVQLIEKIKRPNNSLTNQDEPEKAYIKFQRYKEEPTAFSEPQQVKDGGKYKEEAVIYISDLED